MRPPAPVPGTEARSMPCSLAMRRTSGELWTRPPFLPEEVPGPEAVGCAGDEVAGLGAACGGALGAGRACGGLGAGVNGSRALSAGGGGGGEGLWPPPPPPRGRNQAPRRLDAVYLS